MKAATSTKDRRSWWIGLCFLVLLGVIFVVALAAMLWVPRFPWRGFKEPDDIGAGRELLAEKFVGPRYFQYVESPEHLPAPFISVDEAGRQIESILSARRPSSLDENKLARLVDSLAEPSSSRIAGASQVNMLRLNLALDEQK